MENTLEKHLDGIIKKYQEKNIRNATKIGRAVGKLCFAITYVENNTDLTNYNREILLRDLKDIYENVNEIEL